MFLDQNPIGQSFDGIVVEYGHSCLQNDRTGVETAVDKVHGRARHPNAVLEGLPLGMQTGERRQKRWMDVQNPMGKSLEQHRANQAHVARETHEANVEGPQRIDDSPVVPVAVRVPAWRQVDRFDPSRPSVRQSFGIPFVRNDDRDRGVEASRGDGVENRPQVAPTAGDQDCKSASHVV